MTDELQDILEELVFEDEPTIFDESSTLDLIESALHLMIDYMNQHPTAITEPDFHDEMLEEVQEMFYIQFEDIMTDWVEQDLDDILDDAFDIFTTLFDTKRSGDTDIMQDSTDIDKISKQIAYLRSKPQPAQRTLAWLLFRYNIISASNAYKAYESQSTINQLIYEKCRPMKQESDMNMPVNVNSTLHWGQKYEPVSVMFYEHTYKTKIADFGCIKHDKYDFIGASPDGINESPSSERHGRMLEIKNIVNREITGIPKKEYWIQMQLQMEVCDLDECDFLETKFVEYEDYQAYLNDDTDKMKGFIMYFTTSDAKPFYVYKPLDLVDSDEWEQTTMDKHEEQGLIWIKNCYWKLDIVSCVLVTRNKQWFADNVGQLEKIWRIIEQERITGYEHRAPKKRAPKAEPVVQQGCLLKMKSTFPPLEKVEPNMIVGEVRRT
jgi:putative phage-type endonuclease